jgi:hypothetical protein
MNKTFTECRLPRSNARSESEQRGSPRFAISVASKGDKLSSNVRARVVRRINYRASPVLCGREGGEARAKSSVSVQKSHFGSQDVPDRISGFLDSQ